MSLIEKQAAMDVLEKVAGLYPWRVPGDRDSYSSYNEAWNDALNRAESEIEALPSTQPEPHWISCSEMLPENSNTVLITHKCGVSFGWYNGRYWERGAGTKHRLIKTVTAWMPLPEPYKGGE